MANPRKIIENALDESHILILGSQILSGFQYQAVFRPGFEQLSGLSRNLNVLALLIMLAATRRSSCAWPIRWPLPRWP